MKLNEPEKNNFWLIFHFAENRPSKNDDIENGDKQEKSIALLMQH